MTREEAITYLKVIWNRYKAEYEIERETLDAYHMAIEALSADIVSREEYEELYRKAKEVNEMANDILADFPSYKELLSVANLKEKFESADAVQGEWIWRTDIPIGGGRTSAGYICSNCGEDYWHGNVFKYCPSCGAKMKGGAE